MGIVYLFLKKMDQANGSEGKYQIERYFCTVCNNDQFLKFIIVPNALQITRQLSNE
jgi:hypothetical protein